MRLGGNRINFKAFQKIQEESDTEVQTGDTACSCAAPGAATGFAGRRSRVPKATAIRRHRYVIVPGPGNRPKALPTSGPCCPHKPPRSPA
eukprot:359256-Chlamydomonas_euryale.AAC.1